MYESQFIAKRNEGKCRKGLLCMYFPFQGWLVYVRVNYNPFTPVAEFIDPVREL